MKKKTKKMPKKSSNSPVERSSKTKRLPNPAIKGRFRLVFFVSLFVVLGVATLLLTGAKSEIPGGEDEIVFSYEKSGPLLYAKSEATDEVTDEYQPYEFRLTGDGTLLCSDGSTHTLKKGKLNGAQISQLYQDIKNTKVGDLPDEIDINQKTEKLAEFERITIGNNERSKFVTIYPGAQKPDSYERAVKRLLKDCDKATEKVKNRDVKPVKGLKLDKKSTLSWSRLNELVFKKAFAADYYGYSQNDEIDQYNRINGHRSGHGLNSPYRSGCLTNAAREWVKYMGDNSILAHSNTPELVKKHCGIDFYSDSRLKAIGENVGYGGDSASIFNAYLNSPCHHSNIDSRKASYNPCNPYGALNSLPWDVIGTAAYMNQKGTLYTIHIFAYCPTNCSAMRTAPSQAPAPTQLTSHRVGWANGANGALSMDWYGKFKSYNMPAVNGPSWNWAIARDVEFNPSGTVGYLMDGFGGIHPVSTGANAKPPSLPAGAYWNGWDIARDLEITDWTNMRGYKMDGWGGISSINGAPAASGGGYWSGWDIARKFTLLGNGSGGYQLDAFGGVHAFATGSNSKPPAAKTTAYWNGWDIARDIEVNPNGTGGFVLDGFGGLHPFSTGNNPLPPNPSGGYYAGKDMVIDLVITDWSTYKGYVVDRTGKVYPINGATAVQ